MDFKEWFRKHEREVFKRNQGCFDTAYKFGAKQGYEAGQQSKQAEIDALREMVKKLIDNTVLSIDDELEDKANNLLEGNKK